MAEFDLHREFHDELLSAYLDGELSAAERARVEQRLAVDPIARQMLDDLRSVSQAVQGLPVEKVGDDLRPAILQRAQEALIASREQQAATAIALLATSTANGKEHSAPVSSAGSSSKLQLPELSIGRTRRGWVWAAAAVAAAVVIMVVQRGEERDGELPSLAKRDAAPAESARRTPDESTIIRSFDDRTKIAATNNEPNGDRSVNQSTADEARESVVDRVGGTAGLPPSDAPADYFKMKSFSEGRDATVAEAAAPSGGEIAADKDKRLDTGIIAAAPPGQPLQYDFAAEPKATPGDGSDKMDIASGLPARNEPAGAATATDTFSMSRSGGENKSRMASDIAPTITESKDAAAPINRANASNRERLLVVVANVKRDALNGRAFDQKLADNQISLDVATATSPELSPGATAPIGDRESLLRDDLASNYYADWSFVAASVRELPEAQAILVEAPPEQMERLIGALDADAENVVSIAVSQLDSAGKIASTTPPTNVDFTKYRRVNAPQELRELSQQLAGGPIQPPAAGETAATPSMDQSGRRGRGLARGGRGAGGRVAAGGGGGGRGGGGGAGRGGAIAQSGLDNKSGDDKQGATDGAAPRGDVFGGGSNNISIGGSAQGFGGVNEGEIQRFGTAANGGARLSGATPLQQESRQTLSASGNLGQAEAMKQQASPVPAPGRALDFSDLGGNRSGQRDSALGIDGQGNGAAVPWLGRAKRVVLSSPAELGERRFLNFSMDAEQSTAGVIADNTLKALEDSRATSQSEELVAQDRGTRTREPNSGGQFLTPAPQPGAARQTVQVLFVLRPEPTPTAAATAAPAGPTTPATSPPPADPAK